MTLLLTFIFAFGFASTIRELALAHTRMQQLIGELEGSNAELEAAHTQLLEYTTQVEDLSAVRERNRIAREIHDTLGHSLTLLAVQLETATQLEVRGDASLHEELLEARRVAKACLADVRHSVEALRPDAATAGPFEEALRQLVAEAEMTSRETLVTLDREISEALYITGGTVKNHLSNILGKLNVRDRTQAALKARELGLM